jgi:arylformamidase
MRLIVGALAVGLLPGFSTAAEPAAKVWRDLDQAALDAAYNQSVYAANLEQVLARCAANSALARSILGEPQHFTYGDAENETLDVYPADRPDAPIHIFIHGGAWRLGSAKDNAFAAEMFVRAGVHFVVPDFSPVQEFDGDLRPMVDQLRRALLWIHAHGREKFGGDPDRITVSGFSSGGHLAAVLLTTDWSRFADTPPDVIKGGLICSGMFDLVPVSLSSRRDYVNFTPDVIEQLSPLRHLDRIRCPVIVAHGTLETPEF